MTATATHTPGPWKVSPCSKITGIMIWRSSGEGEKYVRICRNANPLDAPLLSAAPEMLDACRKALTCASIPDYVADVIRAAIAKAESR